MNEFNSVASIQEPAFFEVEWLITRRCNYRCWYCQYHQNVNEVFPDFSRISTLLDVCARKSGKPVMVYILGGEPFISHFLEDALILLQNQRCVESVVIQTNFSQPVHMILNYPKVSLKVTLHPDIVNDEHELQKFLTKIRMCEGRVREINIMSTGKNEDWLRHVYSTCAKKFATDIYPVMLLDAKEGFKTAFSDFPASLIKGDSLYFSKTLSLDGEPTSYHDLEKKTAFNFKGWSCHVPMEKISLDYDNTVHSCFANVFLREKRINLERFLKKVDSWFKPMTCKHPCCRWDFNHAKHRKVAK